jgi:GGDEF domain-containing protein
MVFSVTLLVIISGLIAAFVVQSNPSHYLWVAIGALVLLGQLWFLKSSYRVRRFVTALMNKRLIESGEVPPGYENPPLFKERLEQELARARRRKRPLSLVVVTVTGRKLNQPGASPLENPKFLEDLLHALRREDIKGRFSNDRLAFLLVETEREVAEEVTKRIQDRFAAIQDGESGDLQYGIGLSSFPDDGDQATDLFKVAEAEATTRCALPAAAPLRMGQNGGRLQNPLNPPRTQLPELGGSS